jgi:hypothetical protein
MNHNTEDISITMSLLLPCQQLLSATLQSCSPPNRRSKHHVLLSQYVPCSALKPHPMNHHLSLL